MSDPANTLVVVVVPSGAINNVKFPLKKMEINILPVIVENSPKNTCMGAGSNKLAS
jgi:hypothetical protein